MKATLVEVTVHTAISKKDHLQHGQAHFKLYGDGWRIEGPMM